MQGRQQWSVTMSASITALEVLDYKAKSLLGLLVALDNCEVHTYVEKTHVDTIATEDVVTAMKFGRFGREESSLVMITRGRLRYVFVVEVLASKTTHGELSVAEL